MCAVVSYVRPERRAKGAPERRIIVRFKCGTKIVTRHGWAWEIEDKNGYEVKARRAYKSIFVRITREALISELHYVQMIVNGRLSGSEFFRSSFISFIFYKTTRSHHCIHDVLEKQFLRYEIIVEQSFFEV